MLHFNDKLYDFLAKTYSHFSLYGCRYFDATSVKNSFVIVMKFLTNLFLWLLIFCSKTEKFVDMSVEMLVLPLFNSFKVMYTKFSVFVPNW